MIKTKITLWRAGFFPANQSFLKTSDCSDWLEKSQLSKKSHFYFDYVNRLPLSFKGFKLFI